MFRTGITPGRSLHVCFSVKLAHRATMKTEADKMSDSVPGRKDLQYNYQLNETCENGLFFFLVLDFRRKHLVFHD